MVQAHYRSPINYSKELLDACKASLERLYQCRETLKRAIENAHDGEIANEAKALFEQRKEEFILAMDDDLNTADAITSIFELVRDLNIMCNSGKTSKQQLIEGQKLFDELTEILGLLYNTSDENEIPQEVLDLAQQRTEARKAKDFAKADELRDKITALGYSIKETRQGTEIKKIQ
jgi:cysteinyl-tRNA synthetase